MTQTMNVPQHIAARIAARDKSGTKSALTSAIVGDGLDIPRISLKASRFRLVDQGVETVVGHLLDVIVVGANPKVSKVYYEAQYDSNKDNVPPTCFSTDGITPDPSVQAPVCDSCANCPFNVLGSKITPTGAKSKMCADQRHLAVVAAADPRKVYSLTVPVSGMKALREYFKDLANYNISPEEVITELGFDDEASYPKITFRQKAFVQEKALPLVDQLINSDDTKIAVRLMAPPNRPALPPAAESMRKQIEQSDPEADAYEDEAQNDAAKAAAELAAKRKAEAEAKAKAAAEAAAQQAAEEAERKAKAEAAAQAKEKPKVAPVKASDELAAQLDSLFD